MMTRMPFKRPRFKWITLLLVTLLGIAVVTAPWNRLAQEHIQMLLAHYGFAQASLNLSHVGLRHAQVETLRLTSNAPALFDTLTLHYSPMDLISGHVRDLIVSGLRLELQQTPSGWLVNGASVKTATSPSSSAAFTIPVSDEHLSGFPPDAELRDGAVHVTAHGWSLDAPLALRTRKTPDLSIELTSHDVNVAVSGATFGVAKLTATLRLDKSARSWKGSWQADAITVKGQESLLPTLKGSGTLDAQKDTVTITGDLASADPLTHATFALSYPLNAPEKAQGRLISAALPWNKGILSVKDTIIPLGRNQDIRMTLHVEHIPVQALMTMLTGKETLATGVLSGAIPITFKSDGSLAIGKGALRTEQPGIMSLNPETIPGDNEQIALVRDVMKNLHYTLLSISMNGEPDRALSVIMAVEGNNPDVAQGRPVKLNVQLTGDLLNFVQQSLLSLLDPHMFLKPDSHAKP